MFKFDKLSLALIMASICAGSKIASANTVGVIAINKSNTPIGIRISQHDNADPWGHGIAEVRNILGNAPLELNVNTYLGANGDFWVRDESSPENIWQMIKGGLAATGIQVTIVKDKSGKFAAQ